LDCTNDRWRGLSDALASTEGLLARLEAGVYGRTAKLHEAVLRELYLETKETTQSARWACQGWNERTGWHHHAGHPLAGQGIHSRAINAALVEKAAKIIAILGDQVADAQQVVGPGRQ